MIGRLGLEAVLSLVLLVLAAPKAPAAAPARPLLPSRAAVFLSAPSAPGEALKAEATLLEAMQAAEVPRADLGAQFPPPAVDQAGAEAVKAARQAYEDLDYEAAQAKWTEALAAFTQHPEAADSKGLGEVHFFTAVLALQNGGKSQAKKAQEEFARALLHDPDLTLDPQTYGADAKKAFDKAVQEVAARGVAPLTIESEPVGAEVRLRGRSLGHTPLAEPPSVPVGRHLVTFSLPGHAPAGVLADVSKSGSTARGTLEAAQGYGELRAAAGGLVASGLGTRGKVPAGARKVATVARSRFLVVGDQVTAEVWDVETGNRLTGLPLASDSAAETARRIKDFVLHPAPLLAEGDTADDADDGVPLLKKWWFWTAVGVVAVGGATTAGVVAANNSGGRPFNVVLGMP